MDISFIQGEGNPLFAPDGVLSGVTEVEVDLGDGYKLTVKEEDGNQNIDMLYPDGQSLRFESLNK